MQPLNFVELLSQDEKDLHLRIYALAQSIAMRERLSEAGHTPSAAEAQGIMTAILALAEKRGHSLSDITVGPIAKR